MNLPNSDATSLAFSAEACGIGMWFTRTSGHTEWNAAVRDHLLLPLVGEISPALFFRGIEAKDCRRVRAALEKSAVSGEPFTVSFRTPKRGGEARFIRAAGRARLAADGELVLIEGQSIDETEQVRAQARLAALADATPALLWVMEPDGFCSFFSRSWYDFTGQTPQEALGLGWLQTVHPDDLEPTARHAKIAVGNRTAFESVHRLKHRTEGWRWVLCVGQPRFSSTGKFLGHTGAVTDIHERKTAEQRMRQSEERYRHFIANSNEGIWRVEFEPPIDTQLPRDEQIGRVLGNSVIAECNDAFARMYGFGSGMEVVGQSISQMLPPDDPATTAFLAAVIDGGYRATDLESRERTRDGREVYFTNSITGVVEGGLLMRAWGTQRDVSVRRSYETVLLQEARRKDEFLTVLAHDLQERLAPIRQRVEQARQAVPRDPALLRHRELLDRQLGNLTRLMDDLLERSAARRRAVTGPGQPDRLQAGDAAAAGHPVIPPDAQVDPVQLVETVMRLLTQSIGAALDANHQALRVNEEKNRFLAAASHDLRQPLHALALAADTLQAKLGQTEHAQDMQFLLRSVSALTRSLDGMLDLSRLDAGAVTPRCEPVALAGLFAELHQRFNARANRESLALRFAHRGATVSVDRQLLLRLLSNVVDNALKYTSRGGVLVIVRNKPGSTPPVLDIEVRDSGIGIPEQHRAHVFEEFYQVGNSGRMGDKGLGLGLSIVQRLANLMQLKIEIRSAPGLGTTVALTCPVATSVPVAEEPTLPPVASAWRDSRAYAQILRGKRVLVVDDEPSILQAVKRLLLSQGARVDVAASSAGAAAAMRTGGPYDVALLDYRLGEMSNGALLASQLASLQDKPLAFILVTGDTASDEIRAMRSFGTPVLFKPLRADALLSAVCEALPDVGRDARSGSYARIAAADTAPAPLGLG